MSMEDKLSELYGECDAKVLDGAVKLTVYCRIRGAIEAWDDELLPLLKDCSCPVCRCFLSRLQQFNAAQTN